MDKMRMESLDMTAQNIEKIGALFPNCITETIDEKGKPKKAINFELLKQMLSGDVIEGSEVYEFTWVGKKAAIVEANKPIRKTLRPCKEESVNWDTTENLYIEGDNLEVLKLLQESYLGAIKMIYIDPPYNTGSDFIYRDDFGVDSRQWLVDSGQYDEEGNRMFRNTDSNGRFHSDWCSMMYSRLMLARNLLAEDGVIFISIDDNEQHNMKKIADEVFGEDNFLAQVIWERAFAPVNLKKHFSESHDYVICYAKNLNNAICNGLPRNEEANNRYSNPDNDPRGVWMSSDMTVGPVVNSKLYEIISPNGTILRPASGRCWLFTKERFEEMKKDNRIWFGPDGNNMPRVKKFLSEVKQGLTPMTIWKYSEVGHSQDAAQRLKDLFGGKSYFDYPKSVELLKRCIQLYSDKDCFVLDFFSGSATTAHAVMKLNAEDGGKRKFIMVQLPEVTDENSEAYKDGYKTICEIGKERIRRAGRLISGQLIVDSGQLIVDSGWWERDKMEVVRMGIQSFKELLIWQKGMLIAKEIYSLVKKLPKEEIYALSDQMRRAAVSIPSNIAEGQSRNSTKEFIRFLAIANGSKAELETQLLLCKEIGYLTEEEIQPVMNLLQEESKMLHAMKAKLQTLH